MGYETEVVHPAAAKWLEEHGYTYRHEVRTPAGIIDFLATHQDGHKLILECKGSAGGHLATLRQILDYKRYLGGGYRCAIAIPSYAVTNAFRSGCGLRGVKFILLDVPSKLSYHSGGIHLNIVRLYFWFEMWKMTDFHTHHKTNPAMDFSILADIVSDFPVYGKEVVAMIHDEFMSTTSSWITRPVGNVYYTPERIVDIVVRVCIDLGKK